MPSMDWQPGGDPKLNAQKARHAKLEAERKEMLLGQGVNRHLVEAVWGPRSPLITAVLEAFNGDPVETHWIDWHAAQTDNVVPLASMAMGEHGFVIEDGQLMELMAPDPPAPVAELKVWVELLGCCLVSELEEAETSFPEAYRDESGRLDVWTVRDELERIGSPELLTWFDAVAWLVREREMAFWDGQEVDEAIREQRTLPRPAKPKRPWWKIW